MAKLTLTLSANAGVAIAFGGKRIWIDALHNDVVPGFSTIDKKLLGKMLQCEAFFQPDVICVTHCHGDHFSREMMLSAMELWPQATVLLPERKIPGQLLIEGEVYLHRAGALEIRFVRLPHEGEEYANVIHYGILLSYDGKNVLLSGDCRRCAPELAQAIRGQNIDAAILDFPWLTLKKGREFVAEHIGPRYCIGYHLPFAEDDSNGFRGSAQKAALEMGAALLMDPLQTIELEL